MSTPIRLATFVAGLAVVFVAAIGVGRLVDPVHDEPAPTHGHDEDNGHQTGHEAGHEAGHEHTEVLLEPARRELSPGRQQLRFTLRDADGEPITAYDEKHERDLHLIVLGTRSLTDFQHVHPRQVEPGTWTVPVLLAPGTAYRLYADGSTTGSDFVATADVYTTGSHPAPDPVPEPAGQAQVDGFDVTLTRVGDTARLWVSRDGASVPLEPYLGALGHLVVIRVDDLSYLHVHPTEGTADPEFEVADLAAGSYRFFFDFQVDGTVHTASFTVEKEGAGGEEGGHDHDH